MGEGGERREGGEWEGSDVMGERGQWEGGDRGREGGGKSWIRRTELRMQTS